jgi:hypothetical protein
MVMLDGNALLLLGIASLSPRTGNGMAASLLVAYWAAMLSISQVVYLKMLFGAQKGSGCSTLRPLFLTPVILVP